MIKAVVYAAVAAAGIVAGAFVVQVVDGGQIGSLTAKVSVLSQTASRCEEAKRTQADIVKGLGTLSQPYHGINY
jgi:hypothetical protein